MIAHITEAARNYNILGEKHMSLILYKWSKLSGSAVIDEFISKVLSDDILTLKFIKGFSSITRSASEGAVIAKSTLRIRLDWMKDFVEVSKVYDKAKTITAIPTDNDDELRHCYDQFMKEYEAFSKGKSLVEW